MKLGTRCTVCRERVTETDLERCSDCGHQVHNRCAEYERAFECRTCGEELWIGAVEF